MSSPTRMASTAKVTIWERGDEDVYGRVTYTSRAIDCCVDLGGRKNLIDGQGNEYTPILTAWFEFNNWQPKLGDYVIKGESTESIPSNAGAFEIRTSILEDCSSIGEIDDVMIGA